MTPLMVDGLLIEVAPKVTEWADNAARSLIDHINGQAVADDPHIVPDTLVMFATVLALIKRTSGWSHDEILDLTDNTLETLDQAWRETAARDAQATRQ